MTMPRRSLVACLLFTFLAALLLGGCSGSGATGAGGTRVNVSLAASSSARASLDAAAADPSAPRLTGLPDHAWITVTRVALLPADDDPGTPDPAGEEAVCDGDAIPDGGQLVRVLASPAEVDLLSLPSFEAALFLDAFDRVPAGTYRKLRLYYRDPKVHFPGDADNTAAHATANYHLDLHFRQGGLVIPASTDPDVRIVNVAVNFVLGNEGLKITANASKILMRPQVFCTVDALKYLLRGTADNVDSAASSFDLATSTGRSFPVLWSGGSSWRWIDDSTSPPRPVDVDPSAGAASLRDTALVAVTGEFEAGTGAFLADRIDVTFPALRTDDVLLPYGPDNTFLLGTNADNVTVFPFPSKEGARYDNMATLAPLANGWDLVLPGVRATVRGYATPSGIDAYWISLSGAPAAAGGPVLSPLATGTAGTILYGQSFNETRAVTLSVAGTADRVVSAMTLDGLNVVDGTGALVGARIYDAATGVLLATANGFASPGFGSSVTVPISATLRAGRSYRVGFYVETSPLWMGSCTVFRPADFTLSSQPPYVESTGTFRIEGAHSFPADTFPTYTNVFVPLITVASTAG